MGNSRLKKHWSDAAQKRLDNSARGEWSPWQAIKQNTLAFPLGLEEQWSEGNGGLGGDIPFLGPTSGAAPVTKEREAAFDSAMKIADEFSPRAQQAADTIKSGNYKGKPLSNEQLGNLSDFLIQGPQYPSAWLKVK